MTLARPDGDPDLAECLASTSAHLPQLRSNWDAISTAIEAFANASISSIRLASKRVIHVETVTGPSFAVKFGNPSAPLAREVATLRFLSRTGCRVPIVIATDAMSDEPEWIATEWAGTRTLGAYLGECTASEADVAGLHLAVAVGQIERAFAEVTRRGVPEKAREMALKLAEPWAASAVVSLASLFAIEITGQLHTTMERVVETALSAPLTAGPLDYHASNVVVGNTDPRLTVIDLGAIGYDWPGRRLAQYAMSVQSGVPGGRFRTALTPEAVTHFAQRLATIHGGDGLVCAREVDAHAILICSVAATQLRAISAGAASPERTVGWGDGERRRASLRRIVMAKLSADGPANEMRCVLGQH